MFIPDFALAPRPEIVDRIDQATQERKMLVSAKTEKIRLARKLSYGSYAMAIGMGFIDEAMVGAGSYVRGREAKGRVVEGMAVCSLYNRRRRRRCCCCRFVAKANSHSIQQQTQAFVLQSFFSSLMTS